MTLLEKYSNRLKVSEALYAQQNRGAALPHSKKIATAVALDNTNKFLTEAFNNSVGTQRADLGMWKKFCLNLTNVVVPSLIAPELVIEYPMTSINGYITYLEYTLGSNKGASKQGDVINSPFKLGDVDVNYTGALVPEAHKTTAAEASAHEFELLWTPVAAVTSVKIGDTTYTIADAPVADTSVQVDGNKIKFHANDTKFVDAAVVNVLYTYDNVVIPQNDIPTINVKMSSKALVAKARRVAVYYSQIAAFQAKQDYGFDLGDQLVEKAVGQLAYEIDTEVVKLLIDNAGSVEFTWNRKIPQYVSLSQHYESFGLAIEKAKQVMYDRTKRFAPNYMICASDVATILPFLKGWKEAPATKINGPYFAGTLNAMKVFVSPAIEAGTAVLGLNGEDMMSSAAVLGMYMPIVPTQLLGFADGAMNQGFSSLYALEMLNSLLLVKIAVVDQAYS